MMYQIDTSLPKSIFRAYDIRGIVDETLTENGVYTIARALATELKAKQRSSVIVARDGRLSGPTLIKAVIAGFVDGGIDVIDIGRVPTPVLYFAANTLACDSGVMLTGSHNPTNYNGLKLVIAGKTFAGESIDQLYARIENKDFSEGAGVVTEQSIVAQYVDAVTKDITVNKPLKVVMDCGNGVAGELAPALYEKLGVEVIPLFCEVDGNFPNHHPDPSIPENYTDLIKAVKTHQADVGVMFDGDADRLGLVTEKGDIVWADHQMMLFVQAILQQHPGETVLFDVKSSKFLIDVIKAQGGKPLMGCTGHSLIKKKLYELDLPFAGEMSGHLFFNDKWYGFDDGMYTGVRLLELLSATDQPCSELFSGFPSGVATPELKLACADDEKFALVEAFRKQADFPGATLTTIDGLRADFTDGWGLVRASNTTPYLTLRFEADDEAGLSRIQALFRDALLKVNKDFDLPF